jgi:hypothetical protein
LFAFGDPLEPVVWILLFITMLLATFALMVTEGYNDNESLPFNPWGLFYDCWFPRFTS